MRNLMLAGSIVGLLLAAPAGAVVTTFASYTQLGTASTLRNVRTGATANQFYTTASGSSTVPGSVGVSFNFLEPALVAAGFSNLSATMTLSFTQAGNASLGTNAFPVQNGYVGSFSFIYSGTTPLVIGSTTFTTGANLLSGTIGGSVGATIAGSGSSGNLTAATGTGRTVTYTSDVLSFDAAGDNDIALSLTSIIPGLSAGASQSLNNFRASGTGSFSSDPAPVPIGFVPEPATWGMLVLGFGMVGAHLRRRRRIVLA